MGLFPSKLLRLLKQLASKRFKLSGGDDGLTIVHAGSMVDLDNNRTTVAFNVSTRSDQTKMADSVVSDTVKVHILVSRGNSIHIRASDGTVGTSVNETTLMPGVLPPMVADRVLVWCGGSHS